MTDLRMLKLAIISAAFILPLQASTITVPVDVDSRTMPWFWDSFSLNTTFQYGIQDGIGPVVVDSSSGISFEAGGTLTITYVGGLTSASPPEVPVVDGAGYGNVAPSPFMWNASQNLGTSGKLFPAFFIDTYPIFLNTLVGTFTDLTGNIVGMPFAVFNGPVYVYVPVGATRLQLGINDDIFYDNKGSLQVDVSGTATPEPASFLAMGCSLIALLTAQRYRDQTGNRGRG